MSLRLADSAAAYVEILNEERARVSAGLAAQTRCYCDVRDAVLALRPTDCVFEYFFALFDRFKEHQAKDFRGFEFFFENEDAGREYSVWRTHSRLVAGPATGGDDVVRGVIESRLVEAKDLRLVVTGDTSSDIRAGLWKNDSGGDRQLLLEIPAVQSRDQLTVYESFEADLREALHPGKDAIEVLAKAGDRVEKDPFLYPAINSIIARLLQLKNAAEVRAAIASLLARLWDGPLVATQARRIVERSLDSHPDEMPGRLRWNLEQLEAADRFLLPV